MTKKPVVCYGAGIYSAMLIKVLDAKYAPVAFCDSDAAKHGGTRCGRPVLSIEQVRERYPDCLFYISTPHRFVAEITGLLLNLGIPFGRIINGAAVKEYISCTWLESIMMNWDAVVRFCCSDFGRNQSPEVLIGSDPELAIRNFIRARDDIIECVNNGRTRDSNGRDIPCVGCYELKKSWWDAERRISGLKFNYPYLCNFKCIYCTVKFPHYDRQTLIEDTNKSLDFLRFLKNNGHIADDTDVELASGELSVHPMCDEILSEVGSYRLWVYSNATRFSEKLAWILAKGRSKIVSSLDCGTRETFAKIKGADVFDEVCDNLRCYAEHGCVELKYIVLPGVNDNEADIDGFVSLCREMDCVASIARNHRDMSAFSDHTIDMIARLEYELDSVGVNFAMQPHIFAGSGDAAKVADRLAQLKYGT